MTDTNDTIEPRTDGFATIDELIDEIRAGRMVIMVDDDDRENEGDLIMAAQHVSPDAINFIRTHTGGWICIVLDDQQRKRLGLSLIESEERNSSMFRTAFMQPVDATRGITTGISAADRAVTVRAAIAPDATPADVSRGGHMATLLARDGGVLVRTGHTEASVDLCRLAGARPAAVLSEVMNTDGSMARVPQLQAFAKKHGLKIGTIADLVEYRRRAELLVDRVATVKLPTDFGEFQLVLYRSLLSNCEHIALTYNIDTPTPNDPPAKPIAEPLVVRVHSECLTGDVFGSLRCDCGAQLHEAQRRIAEAGRGVLLYMRQEGRGIGLLHKMRAYMLQEQGLDTVEANEKLGFAPDQRDYGIGAQILYDLGVRKMRLLTNNPRKFSALGGYGLEIVERLSIEIDPNPQNEAYLRTKKDKLGHDLHYWSQRANAVKPD